ncbi:MAG TPA: hypothetical protein VFR85_19205 [Anaeromyxobacteraceae bacterium]|nr:hypothetical protein [Anaeromyxobacteraceae bacterium]
MMIEARRLGRLLWFGALLAPLAAAAHGGPGRDGMGEPGRMFDPDTVTTVQGRISHIQRIDRGRGHRGIHVTLAVGSEALPVHLGPDFYVDGQGLKLAEGDVVEVKGSRVTFQGEPAIIAQELRRGADVLALRDADGVPLWRGHGGGRR